MIESETLIHLEAKIFYWNRWLAVSHFGLTNGSFFIRSETLMIIQHKINEHGIRERLFQLEDADYANIANETLRTELRQFYDQPNPVHLDTLPLPDSRPSFIYGGAFPAVELINNAIRANHDTYANEYKNGHINGLPAVRFVDGRHYEMPALNLSLRKAAPVDAAVSEPDDGDEEAMMLLSTRRVLAKYPDYLYDGYEFKFRSNRHPSPAQGYIGTLLKQYLMQIIIPNALLYHHLSGNKLQVKPQSVIKAINYCMTTGKSETAKAYWEDYKANNRDEVKAACNIYDLYASNLTRDNKVLDEGHRYFLDKHLRKLDVGKLDKFRRGKNTDELAKLLDRMKTEPELKTASKRKLMEMGISQRLALAFMKARVKAV